MIDEHVFIRLTTKWAHHPYMVQMRERAAAGAPQMARSTIWRAARYLETHNGRGPNTEREQVQNLRDGCLSSGPPRTIRQLAVKKAKLKMALSAGDEAILAGWGGADAVMRAAHDPRFEPAYDILRAMGCKNLPRSPYSAPEKPRPASPRASERTQQGQHDGPPQAEHRDQSSRNSAEEPENP